MLKDLQTPNATQNRKTSKIFYSKRKPKQDKVLTTLSCFLVPQSFLDVM
jgi:hypothetical protein